MIVLKKSLKTRVRKKFTQMINSLKTENIKLLFLGVLAYFWYQLLPKPENLCFESLYCSFTTTIGLIIFAVLSFIGWQIYKAIIAEDNTESSIKILMKEKLELENKRLNIEIANLEKKKK